MHELLATVSWRSMRTRECYQRRTHGRASRVYNFESVSVFHIPVSLIVSAAFRAPNAKGLYGSIVSTVTDPSGGKRFL